MMVSCADSAKHVNHSNDPNLLDTPDVHTRNWIKEYHQGNNVIQNVFLANLGEMY